MVESHGLSNKPKASQYYRNQTKPIIRGKSKGNGLEEKEHENAKYEGYS